MTYHEPALRRRLEAAIERAIAVLDRLDADGEDLEDEGDAEPSLGSLGWPDQRGWAMGGDADLEPDADHEPDERDLQTSAEWRAEHKRDGLPLPGGYEPIGF